MNVQFKVMRRSGDKAYILSEITDYDESMPVVLTASTDEGVHVPSESFPYCEEGDLFGVESVLYDAALRCSSSVPYLKNTSSTRFFIIVVPWMNIRRWVLDFRVIGADGEPVSSCTKKLELDSFKWFSLLDSRVNHPASDILDEIDDFFVHDRIRVSFSRAIELEETILVSALLEMPYHESSVIDLDFLNNHGQPIDIEFYRIEESIDEREKCGSLRRRTVEVSFEVDIDQPEVCLCAADTAGNISPGFAMLGEKTLEEVLEETLEVTTSAHDDEWYDEWYQGHRADLPTLIEQASSSLAYEPLISIICPLNETPSHYLYDVMSSLAVQSYHNWELILVNVAEENTVITDAVQSFDDERIYLLNVDENLSIPEKINAGFLAAEGEFVGLLKVSDKIAPDALFEYVRKLNEYEDCDIVYSDSDTFDADGAHSEPIFRPAFSPELLRSYCYMQDFVIIRSSLLVEVGTFSEKRSGAYRYDLLLRATERARRVCHIPRVLTHRRYAAPDDDLILFELEQEAGRQALVRHCKRLGVNAEVLCVSDEPRYHVRYLSADSPRVAVVIPSQNNGEQLMACVRALYQKCAYKNFEVLVVNVGVADETTRACYEQLQQKYATLSVLQWDGGFDRVGMANFAVENTDSEYYFFITDTTRIIEEDTIEGLLGYFQLGNVGVVGPKQLFVDGTVEHAGIAVGGPSVANALSRYLPDRWRSSFSRLVAPQNVSAVSGDCLMVSRKVFEEVGGFTQAFSTFFADVDFCLKVRKAGYYVVYTPQVILSRFGCVSRTRGRVGEPLLQKNREASLLQYYWPEYFVQGDEFYNRNLDQASLYYALDHYEE